MRALLAALSLAAVATPAHADFAVRDGVLVQGDGSPFLMRGVNVQHAWAPAHTMQSLEDIAGTGANTVRIVLSNGARWNKNEPREVARLLDRAKDLGLIVMLEVHDTTGLGADPAAAHIGTTIPYWLELQEVLEGQEDYVLVNIGNEPTAGSSPPTMWLEAHRTAIAALRYAGFKHTIVIDAHDYGQDGSNTMRDRARELFDSDPLHNILFSVHMYQVYADGARVEQYFNAFRDARLPLIVGEFGMDHAGEPVDEETIFRLANEYRFGYLGWSWSGNAAHVADLDIVTDFDGSRLSPWGERLINGAGGIRETSEPAHVFAQRRSWWTRVRNWFDH